MTSRELTTEHTDPCDVFTDITLPDEVNHGNRKTNIFSLSATRYLGIIASVAIAALFRLPFNATLEGRSTFVTLYPAIIFSAWSGGLLGGLLATALCALVAAWFIIPPANSLIVRNPSDQLSLLLFTFIGATISILGEAQRKSQTRVRTAEATLAAELSVAKQRESDTHAISILESISDAFFVVDYEWRFVYVNNQTERSLQRTRRELLGKVMWDEFPEAVGGISYLAYHRAVAEGVFVTFEEYYQPLDTWFEGRAYPSSEGLAVYFQDITIRKRAEETVLRLADIVNSSDDAIIGKTLQGVITSWNPGAETIFGYSAEEAVGQSILILFPPERAHEEANFLARIGRGESIEHFDTVRLRKDGTQIQVSVTLSPIVGSDGKIIGASKIARDITERKQAEDAQKESEALLRTVTDTVRVGLVLLDEERRYLFANASYVEILRLPPVDIVGRYVSVVMANVYDQISPKLDRAFVGERVTFDLQIPARGDASTERTYSATLEPRINTASGMQVLVMVVDITDRKQAEAAIQENEERFRTMINAIPHLAWMAEPDGYIFWYNSRWYEYTGTAPEDMEGWGWQSVHDPTILPVVMENWTGAIASGKSFDMEFPLRGADGRLRPFLTRVYPLKDSTGCIQRWFGTNTDISQMRDAEDHIRLLNAELEQRVVERTEELVAANGELEAFSYSVSHDLRAPLRSIDGFSQALLEDYADHIDSTGKGYLARVRAASQHMSLLIDDLLSLARVTRLELNRQPVNLSEMVTTLCQELAAAHPERVVETIITQGLWGIADLRLLRIVMENFLSNAWKYTAQRETAKIEFGEMTQDGVRCFFVSDNGAGFDMAYADKLFTAFQRLHTQQEFEGTGIGLATVRRILHRHGGRIWAHAAVDQGATFYFTI